jgi:hypothetical protein
MVVIMMKTKLQFRVYDKIHKRYLKGWEEATDWFLGFGNDKDDKTKLSIAFGEEPDDYLEIELIEEGKKDVVSR